MSALVTGVQEKLEDLLPGRIGDNKSWSEATLQQYILLADYAVRERTDNLFGTQEIALVQDQAAYTLDSEFIDVVSVEFAADGSTYDYFLHAATFDDFDRINLKWRDDGSTRPELYTLVSTPGTPTATIHIHRPMTSVTAQTIKVGGHRIGTTTTKVPDDVQRAAHVPYVMAILKAQEEPKVAAMWWGRFLDGVESVRARTVNPYPAGQKTTVAGWR